MEALSAVCAPNLKQLITSSLNVFLLNTCGVVLEMLFGWQDFPTSKHNFLYDWMPRTLGVPRRLVLFFFAGLTWAIWKNRNKMAIQKVFSSNPDVVLYNTITFLQMWRDLMKDADKIHLSKMVEGLETWISKRDRLQTFNSDVAIL